MSRFSNIPQGGLEDTDELDTQIFDNTFLPLHLPSKGPFERSITFYEVVQGDTIEGIARQFNIKPTTIVWANGLSLNSRLKPGQKLTILPVDGVVHEVKKGETLSLLSLLYKVYVEEISEVNNLASDGLIVAGSKLIIPGALPLPPPSKRKIPLERILVDVRGALTNPASGSYRSQGLHWRNAVDLASHCGAPVVAAAPGNVIKTDGTGWNGGFGKYVMLAHAGGFVTVYGHLSRIFVEPGASISQGTQIGSIGATGRATGCHVHFEVRGATNPFAS